MHEFHALCFQYDPVVTPQSANEGITDLEAGVESYPSLQSPLLNHLSSSSHQVILAVETVIMGWRVCQACGPGASLYGLCDHYFHWSICCCLVTKPCLILCNPMDYSSPGSSGPWRFSQANFSRVAISFSRLWSWLRDWTHISCIGRQILYHWTTWEALWSV